jgi:hypothetical protein
MGTGDLSAGVKWPRREADHSPPSSVKFKNGEDIRSLRVVSFWHNAYLVKYRATLQIFSLKSELEYVKWEKNRLLTIKTVCPVKPVWRKVPCLFWVLVPVLQVF